MAINGTRRTSKWLKKKKERVFRTSQGRILDTLPKEEEKKYLNISKVRKYNGEKSFSLHIIK